MKLSMTIRSSSLLRAARNSTSLASSPIPPSLVHVLDVFGFDRLEDIKGDEAVQELGEQFVVVEDGLEAVIFGFLDGHNSGPPIYIKWECPLICFNGEGKK
jgi:hypothetical protein